MNVFTKQPRDVLDYDVDMSAWFAGSGDDIQRVDVTVRSDMEDAPTLTAGPIPHQAVVLEGDQPVRFKVWLGGGTDRVDYVVSCLVVTEADRQKEVEFKIKVRDQ